MIFLIRNVIFGSKSKLSRKIEIKLFLIRIFDKQLFIVDWLSEK
jgi:hypothetical protein